MTGKQNTGIAESLAIFSLRAPATIRGSRKYDFGGRKSPPVRVARLY